MSPEELRLLLNSVAAGETAADAALERLKGLAVEDLGFARVDHGREARCGHPEVLFGQGKTPSDLVAIAGAVLDRSGRVLVTRVDEEGAMALREAHPDGRWEDRARCFVVERDGAAPERVGRVLVVSAGTSDLPVAEEARITAEVTGSAVETLYDAGVAGIHRLLGSAERLHEANAVVVVAGMEGALASVVGGLCDVPVIAVPTSVGYGASFEGVAPLLAMLNSCAAGVGVVNIDNGFGAGFLASRINRLIEGRDGGATS
ncbi:MAG: nickel pincer cofactor biosynthesis protein LarB [Planctomycetota bacterium]